MSQSMVDMSPTARWARVEVERVKRNETKRELERIFWFSDGCYTNSMKRASDGRFLRLLEERYFPPPVPAEPSSKPWPGPKPGTAVLGFDHALARILDQHHIGEPGDHIMLRLGILSERLKNIGGEK